MAALAKTAAVLSRESSIVDRVRAKGSYALGPYMLSKLIAKIPVLAAFPLMFAAVLYPMASLRPFLSWRMRDRGIGYQLVGLMVSQNPMLLQG